MDLARYFSTRRKQSKDGSNQTESHQRRHLPLLATPVNKDVLEVLSSDGSVDLEKLDTHSSSGTLAISKTSSGNPIIYKRHHEASTIELFYDLFFVANLAYFTAMHQHTDAVSLINYLKLFTLLWFTWLSVTLFDVRFSVDCLWNRLCKAVQFGVMTGWVFAGPIFDKYDASDDRRSFKAFALVLAISRFTIALQYIVVLIQGRHFRQTLVPVGLSALVYVCSGVAFLTTRFVFASGAIGTKEQVTWFIFAIVEGLLIIGIAIYWRIVSFKYTHLVERMQLLTLIIIGEGIIGMVKSVACIAKGQSHNNGREVGTVIAACLLLYLIWMLYFDQLSHDRFGTIRQQVWVSLHYPLHAAILFCVEGSTSIIVWNSAVQALKWMWTRKPTDMANPAYGFSNDADFINYLNKTMWDIDARFKSKGWNSTYLWDGNLTTIANYTNLYGFQTATWNNRTGNVVNKMFNNAQLFAFESHADTLAKINAVAYTNESAEAHLQAVYDVFNVTVMQFYIGAGAMLLILAIMYWFNKLHKTKYEFGEMIIRTAIGFALILVGVAAVLVNRTTSGFKFQASEWIIAIVVIGFTVVLILDNILLSVSQRTHRKSQSNIRHKPSWSGSTISEDVSALLPTTSRNAPQSQMSPFLSPPTKDRSTAYAPYSHAHGHARDFASPEPVAGSIYSGESGVTLRDEIYRGNGGLGVTASPPSLSVAFPSENIDDGEEAGREGEVGPGRRTRGDGYESLNVGDEYEGSGYEQHPLSARNAN